MTRHIKDAVSQIHTHALQTTVNGAKKDYWTGPQSTVEKYLEGLIKRQQEKGNPITFLQGKKGFSRQTGYGPEVTEVVKL